MITLAELDYKYLIALRDGLEIWTWLDLIDLMQGESTYQRGYISYFFGREEENTQNEKLKVINAH